MSWEKANKFGILKVEGKSVKMYSSQTSANVINIGYDIKDVRWSGNDLLVYLMDGKVRKYKNFSNYSVV